MGLELKAEEKSILALFTGDKNQYIIPPYQRPYSWDKEQCEELFNDLERAFEDEKTNEYFLGNIVIASSREEKNRLEVIDGQQRLTTLTLLIKAFLHFDKDNKKLENSIWELDRRTGERKEQRLKTMVFQDKDAQFLKDALELEFENSNCKINKKDNQFKKNICYFYQRLDDLDDNKLFGLSDFLLDDVSILPIQTQGDDKSIARENALNIFETINNRGIELSTADILKARLFANSLGWSRSDEFIEQWNLLYKRSQDIEYSIDDIFKIYKTIIELEKNLEDKNINIRDFFENRDGERFFGKQFNEVMSSLSKILDSIYFIRDIDRNPKRYQELTNKEKERIIAFIRGDNED